MEFRHPTRAALLAVVAMLLVGIALWFARDSAERSVATSAGGPAAAASSTGTHVPPVSAPRTTASATRTGEALPQGPASEIYPALVRIAEHGNGAAALRLANLMALCANYVPQTREAAEEQLVKGMARFDPPEDDEQARQQDAIVAMVVAVQDRQHTECPGFDALGIADPQAEQLRWTQLAARHGEAAALVAMAHAMVHKYKGKGDIVEHAEELRVLRPQAMAMLQQAVAAGEPEALLRMAAAHRSGDLAPVDPVEAYAWMLAYRAGSPSPNLPEAAFAMVMHQIEAPLDAAQRVEGQRRAEAIRARCCAGG